MHSSLHFARRLLAQLTRTSSTSKPETVTRISLPQYPGTTAQDHDYMEESKAHGDVLANVRKGDTYGGIVVTVRKDNFSSV